MKTREKRPGTLSIVLLAADPWPLLAASETQQAGPAPRQVGDSENKVMDDRWQRVVWSQRLFGIILLGITAADVSLPAPSRNTLYATDW
jgi:hypothetical protein